MAATPDPPQLQLLPLDVEVGRVLAVAAHPDDLEYGAAAAIAVWTEAGSEVVYLVATRGEAGIDGMPPELAGPVREAEQRAGAGVVGVEVVEFLDHRDGLIQPGLRLRRDIAAAIRRHRPDTLLIVNHRETWAPGRLNTADHRVVGEAALDAVSDAGNRWIFADLRLPPHKVRQALVAASPLATHALDVTATVDRAVASLAEHRAYLDGLGDHRMSDPEFLRMFFEAAGERFGGLPAVAFELFEF
ncbi:MAG TPA: PIG-L deacetylase family protein [Candidatus Eisenbacteria bacterium]|nr:PIG-L deacetylase family protein [Candidatus Eisenbacteria bacterium]